MCIRDRNIGNSSGYDNKLIDISDAGNTNTEVIIRPNDGNSGESRLFIGGSGTNQRKFAIIHDPAGGYCRGNAYFCMDNTGDLSDVDITDTKLTITRDGYVTKPKNPAFAAKGVTYHTGGNVVHIDYTTELFDNRGNYDNTAGVSKFTAPVDGYYFFHATCMFQTNLTGYTYCFMDFKINGTTQGRERMMPRPSGANYATVENSAVFYLTANQYVTVFITQYGGAAMQIRNDYRFFEGFLIG